MERARSQPQRGERTISPASINSASESAISVTTNPLSRRRCARLPAEREPLSAAASRGISAMPRRGQTEDQYRCQGEDKRAEQDRQIHIVTTASSGIGIRRHNGAEWPAKPIHAQASANRAAPSRERQQGNSVSGIADEDACAMLRLTRAPQNSCLAIDGGAPNSRLDTFSPHANKKGGTRPKPAAGGKGGACPEFDLKHFVKRQDTEANILWKKKK